MVFETWFETTISSRVEPTDTTIKLAVAPTATNGRWYIFNNAQKEWISYTGVSGTSITWVTRDLSQTADPATVWTGKTWIAWTIFRVVAMHDQIPDKKDSNVFTGTQTFTTVDFWSTGKFSVPVYATTTARDAAITSPTNWMVVYITADWSFYKYEAGAWSTFASGSVANATTTAAGKVELATQAEVELWTNTGWTWASLVATPWQLNPNNITSATPVASDKILFSDTSDSNKLKSSTISNLLWLISLWYFGDWSDWDVTISTNTTLTRDMYYNNLVINSWVTLNPAWYRIFVKWKISWTWTIARVGNNWTNWSYWTAWVAWATLSQWSMKAELPAWDWWYWTWSAWVGWGWTNPSLTTLNGAAWWAWWTSSFFPNTWAWPGGGWWVATRWVLYNKAFAPSLAHPATTADSWFYANYGNSWAAWWGWGWAQITSTGELWGWWWGWWSNGWLVFISCREWDFTWTVNTTWWNGWNGWSTWWSRWWGWGWGWGGNWWTVVRLYQTITNEATFVMTWWTGWTGWTWNTSWANWSNWSTWQKIDILI